MNSYRYQAPGPCAPTLPRADAIMDQLAKHMLDHDSLEQAMHRLCRRGIEHEQGESLAGLDEIASRLRERRRNLTDRYTLDPLMERLSQQIQSLVRREIEAVQRFSESKHKELNEMAESFLERAADVVKKLTELRDGTRRATPQGTARIENTFEDLFLAQSALEAQSRSLGDEEARRLDTLKDMPTNPKRALEKLKNYDPIDESVREELGFLAEMADEIGAIERARLQTGFCGGEAVVLDEAVGLITRVGGMARLEARLKRGNLSAADASALAETLGPDALACVKAVMQLRDELLRAGYIEEDDGAYRLHPRGIRRIGRKALDEVFSNLGAQHLGGHEATLKGVGHIDPTDTKRYTAGDPLNIHPARTLMNALHRDACRVPIDVCPGDFEVYGERRTVDCSTVLMLDLSYTMAHDGKLQAARKVVLALDSLIRSRFPRDTLHIVGFATHARVLAPEELPHVTYALGDPFTNMQDGLRLAEKLLHRDRGRNRQIILITDGEPSAFCRDGALHIDYPPSPETFFETMAEVGRLTRKGITINTFMLDTQPPLVRFIEQMTAANRGRAFFSTPHSLGEYLLVDYVAHRRHMIN